MASITHEHFQGDFTEPWLPIVLSLGNYVPCENQPILLLKFTDGGGIRGLSSLYILREIMREVQRIERENEAHLGQLAEDHGGTQRGTPEAAPDPDEASLVHLTIWFTIYDSLCMTTALAFAMQLL